SSPALWGRASTVTSTSGTSLTPSVCALASTPSTVMRQTRTDSGQGLRVPRPRAMVKTSFIFEENGASSMTQSVTVPDPHGSEKTARENAEHGFIASDALSKNLQTVLVDFIALSLTAKQATGTSWARTSVTSTSPSTRSRTSLVPAAMRSPNG